MHDFRMYNIEEFLCSWWDERACVLQLGSASEKIWWKILKKINLCSWYLLTGMELSEWKRYYIFPSKLKDVGYQREYCWGGALVMTYRHKEVRPSLHPPCSFKKHSTYICWVPSVSIYHCAKFMVTGGGGGGREYKAWPCLDFDG